MEDSSALANIVGGRAGYKDSSALTLWVGGLGTRIAPP